MADELFGTDGPLGLVGPVRRLTQRVTMRDGVNLATDIYLPAEADRPLPTIIERTPYGRRLASRWDFQQTDLDTPMNRVEIASRIAGHGFAVIIQDCRGCYDSEGDFSKYVHEAEDGFDTLTWLTAQGFCSGKIGSMGMSYSAHTQTAMAALSPPGLACMFLDSGGFWNAFREGIRQGGAFELKQATWAHRHAVKTARFAGDDDTLHQLEQEDLAEWFSRMPWKPGASPLRASPDYEDYLLRMWDASQWSEEWAGPDLCADLHYGDFPEIPVYVLGSWFDAYVRSSIRHFETLAPRAAGSQLVMGPWTHGARSFSTVGEVDFGPSAIFDIGLGESQLEARLAWFKRWLTDDGRAEANHEPCASAPQLRPKCVRVFIMGSERSSVDAIERGHPNRYPGAWVQLDAWPPPGTERIRYALEDHGRLASEAGPAAQIAAELIADPRNPVPSLGGTITSGEPVMRGGCFDQSAPVSQTPAIKTEGSLFDRPDVLVFHSDILPEGLTLVGEVKVHLTIECDQPDADLHIRLLDCFPSLDDRKAGPAFNMAQGNLRLAFRDDWRFATPMVPGTRYEVELSLSPTAVHFAAGHRIGIMITGSSFPQFDINPNSGDMNWEKPEIARTRIFGNGESWITLPILPQAAVDEGVL